MTKKTNSWPDRRKGGDRRKVDKGPPGGRERRTTLEPRKPDVQEVNLSQSDWGRFDANLPIEDDKKKEG